MDVVRIRDFIREHFEVGLIVSVEGVKVDEAVEALWEVGAEVSQAGGEGWGVQGGLVGAGGVGLVGGGMLAREGGCILLDTEAYVLDLSLGYTNREYDVESFPGVSDTMLERCLSCLSWPFTSFTRFRDLETHSFKRQLQERHLVICANSLLLLKAQKQLIETNPIRSRPLRYFNLEQYRLTATKRSRKGISEFFKTPAEESYGLMTLDGKKQATGFPYWKDPYAQQETANKDITKLALDELKKDAHIYLIDEIGLR